MSLIRYYVHTEAIGLTYREETEKVNPKSTRSAGGSKIVVAKWRWVEAIQHSWVNRHNREAVTDTGQYVRALFLRRVDIVDGTSSSCRGGPTLTRKPTASSLTHHPIPYTTVPSIVVQAFDASSSFRDRVEQNPRFQRPLCVRFCAKRPSASYLLLSRLVAEKNER